MCRHKSKSKREISHPSIYSRTTGIGRIFRQVSQRQVETRGKALTQARPTLLILASISPSSIRCGFRLEPRKFGKHQSTMAPKENWTAICNRQPGATKFSRIYKRRRRITCQQIAALLATKSRERVELMRARTICPKMKIKTCTTAHKTILCPSNCLSQTKRCKKLQRTTKLNR